MTKFLGGSLLWQLHRLTVGSNPLSVMGSAKWKRDRKVIECPSECVYDLRQNIISNSPRNLKIGYKCTYWIQIIVITWFTYIHSQCFNWIRTVLYRKCSLGKSWTSKFSKRIILKISSWEYVSRKDSKARGITDV